MGEGAKVAERSGTLAGDPFGGRAPTKFAAADALKLERSAPHGMEHRRRRTRPGSDEIPRRPRRTGLVRDDQTDL